MATNKALGQAFDRVGIFLRRPVFSHGQLEVAVARLTSRQKRGSWSLGAGPPYRTVP